MPLFLLDNENQKYEVLTYEHPTALVSFPVGHIPGLLSHPAADSLKTRLNSEKFAALQYGGFGHQHPATPLCQGMIVPAPDGVPFENRMCFLDEAQSAIALAGDKVACKCPSLSNLIPGVMKIPRPPKEASFLGEWASDTVEGIVWSGLKWTVILGVGVATGGTSVIAELSVYCAGEFVLDSVKAVGWGLTEAGVAHLYGKKPAGVMVGAVELYVDLKNVEAVEVREIVLLTPHRAGEIDAGAGVAETGYGLAKETLEETHQREEQMQEAANEARDASEKYQELLSKYEGCGDKALSAWKGMTKLMLVNKSGHSRSIKTSRDEPGSNE